MRVVTFQDTTVLDDLIKNGFVQTVSTERRGTPKKLSKSIDSTSYFETDGNILMRDESIKISVTMKLPNQILGNGESKRIYPFYAYIRHRFCDDMRHMSIYTIYMLSSHFFGSMAFEGRDIIELEVPDEEILRTRSNGDYDEVVLPYLKKEWLISYLRFTDYTTEPVQGELALAYKNYVYQADTYRMCYSNDVVFNGHGYGDVVECFRSPDLITGIRDVSIQRDYVQSSIYGLFAKYFYIIRHGMNTSDIPKIKGGYANVEMPDEINKVLINSFNACRDDLIDKYGVIVYPTNLTYKERCALGNKSNKGNNGLSLCDIADGIL